MADTKEYIERGDLLRDIEESVVFSCRAGRYSAELRGAAMVKARINAAPTADVVEVVRCKECKYNDRGDCIHPDNVSHSYDCDWNCYEHHLSISDDHFCSHGERKDGADNV